MEKKCPVCEVLLDFEPWSDGFGSQRTCQSCGIHFGLNDLRKESKELVYEEWRKTWIADGKNKLHKSRAAEILKRVKNRRGEVSVMPESKR